jgi:hypothetical protein
MRYSGLHLEYSTRKTKVKVRKNLSDIPEDFNPKQYRGKKNQISQ